MKIIEAMKKLRLIEKKMQGNTVSIEKYASQMSNERPYFGTEDDQRKQVKSLIQSNTDLMGEYLTLKKAIERTNLAVKVTIKDKTYTLSDLLIIKRKMAHTMTATFQSLNTNAADQRRGLSMRGAEKDADGKPLSVVRFYNETDKNESLNYWMELESEISGRLEVVNAVTDLVEE